MEKDLVIENKSKRIDYAKYGYMFIAPFFLVFLIFQAYPIFNTLILSISDLSGFNTEINIVGFSNYVDLIQNELFREAFLNTLIIWGMNFIPQVAVALFLAAVFTSVRTKYKGEGFFKSMFYLPNIITAASMAIIFRTLFQYPGGAVNLVLGDADWLTTVLDWIRVHIFGLEATGYPINFFRDAFYTRGLVAYIQFFMWYGHSMIILMAGIKSISPTLFESAMIDGASSTQMFRKITLPLLKPIILYMFVTSLVGGMQMFEIPFLITNRRGDPEGSINTLAIFIYNQAFTGSRNFYNAAAASVIVLVFVGVITLVLFRIFRDSTDSVKGAK